MYENFIFNKKNNAIFAYVPKVACTNWKSLLRYMNGADDWLENKLAHDRDRSGLTYLKPEFDKPNFGLPDGARRYAMVRNPYERTLSAYLNKIEQRLPPKPDGTGDYWDTVIRQIDTYRQNELDTDKYPSIDLEVFLLWIKHSNDWSTADEHWAPQSLMLRQPEVPFDFIGRFENLSEDAPKILEAMGCDQSFPSQKDVKFAPTNANVRLARYMTPAVEALIENIFALDFANFGYPARSGQDMGVRADIAHLQTQLIRNKYTRFTSVAKNWDEEALVINHFDTPERIQPQDFKSFIKRSSYLGDVIQSLHERTQAAPLQVFDLGAYMGQFAVATHLAAQMQDIPVDITCIEANAAIAGNLTANLDLYGATGHVIAAAASHQNGTASFVFHPSRMAGGRIIDPKNETTPDDFTTSDVDTLDIRSLINVSTLPAIIKLDINGLELNTMRILSDNEGWSSSIFIVNLKSWQLDRDVAGKSFRTWLEENFRIIPTGSALLLRGQTSLDPVEDALSFEGDSRWFILDPLALPGEISFTPAD